VQTGVPAADAFREGGKLLIKLFFPRGTAFAVLFLYVVTAFLCHYNKPAFELNLKIGS
jgi:hypothetical protein